MARSPSPGREGGKLALAVRHVHFEDCGTLGDVLVERGFSVRYLEATGSRPWGSDVVP